MTNRTKQTCHRRGKSRLRVGVLCCALLIPLSISTNVLRAAPLTRGGPLGDMSHPLNHKWLVTQFRWEAPEDATEMQQTEWAIGLHTAIAEFCSYYGKAKDVHTVMKKSPYFVEGYSLISFDSELAPSSCAPSLSIIKEVLGQKEEWEYYLGVAYPD